MLHSASVTTGSLSVITVPSTVSPFFMRSKTFGLFSTSFCPDVLRVIYDLVAAAAGLSARARASRRGGRWRRGRRLPGALRARRPRCRIDRGNAAQPVFGGGVMKRDRVRLASFAPGADHVAEVG